MEFLVTKSGEGPLPHYVMAKLLQCIASLWKRTWLDVNEEDDSEHEKLINSFFSKVSYMLELDIEKKILAVRLMTALVLEFSDAKASAIGMSFENHVSCIYLFQKAGLIKCFMLGSR
jgi:hypothetical protein